MIEELLRLAKILGTKRMLRNALNMKRARADVRGYMTTTVYWALMRVGFVDALNRQGDVDPSEFAERGSLDPRMLDVACGYLVRLGHLCDSGGRIEWTPRGEARWRQVHGVVNIFAAYEPFFANFGAFLAGELETDSQRRDDGRVALGFRETGAAFTFAGLANIIEKEGFSSMVELGCGNIDLSLFVSRRIPSIRCLGIDWDDRFLDEARTTIEAEGLSDRVSVLKHDVFELTPASHDFSPYQLVAAVDLFHGYFYEGPDRLLSLFEAMRESFPTQRFLISEMCLADEDKMHRIAYPMVEHEVFHALTGQRTFAAGELEALLREAGFRILQEWSVRNTAARLFLLFE